MKLINKIAGFILFLLFFSCGPRTGLHYTEEEQTKVQTQTVCGNTQSSNKILGFSGDSKSGQKLFKMYCASCHNFSRQLTGPVLSGLASRIPAPQDVWLRSYILNSDSVIKSKDKYALDMIKNYDSRMPNFKDVLTVEQVNDILAYCNDSYGCK